MSIVARHPLMTAGVTRESSHRIRLGYLDGMRGLAAFYVMLSHIYSLATFDDGKLSRALSPSFVLITRGLNFAHYAVAVFIVLSGFCLMIPVACDQDSRLPGGLVGFAKRRARRILPPYYIALALVLCTIFISHHLIEHGSSGLADMSLGDIATHILLIHNLYARYSMALDGPMWSVAWEWQIYFLFALVLLPLWRRCGAVWTVVAGFIIGFLPLIFLPAPSNLSWTSTWYVGLFTLGMTSAVIMFSQDNRYRAAKNPVVLTALLNLVAASLLVLFFLRPQLLQPGFYWFGDTLVGTFTALFILVAAINAQAGRLYRGVVTFLETRSMMTLGAFSYSLYLVHYPILQKMQDVLHKHHYSHYVQLVVLVCCGIPVCLSTAYLFHLAFERPFMPGKPRSERQTEVAAIISPAP